MNKRTTKIQQIPTKKDRAMIEQQGETMRRCAYSCLIIVTNVELNYEIKTRVPFLLRAKQTYYNMTW